MSKIGIKVGQRIRELRSEKGMSQEELGFKSGISAAHLGQIERALKTPTIETVWKIADALDIPIAALFSSSGVSSDSVSENNLITKINAHLSAMTEEEQKDILKMIRILKRFRDSEEH